MLHTIDPPVPSRQDVRSALLWALEYDREALLEHRETTHNSRWDTARRRADRQIVRRWRASGLGRGDADGPLSGGSLTPLPGGSAGGPLIGSPLAGETLPMRALTPIRLAASVGHPSAFGRTTIHPDPSPA